MTTPMPPAEQPGAERRPMPPPDRPVVAAFDFDGTLSRQDTLVPFLRFARGTRRVALAAARCARHAHDRDALKLALLSRLFKGWPAEDLHRLGRTYAAWLQPLLREDMVERLRWHQERSHSVVLVSASLGAYLCPLAETLRIDGALAVELVTGPDGKLTGEVVGGANTRGSAKVARLRDWIDERFWPGCRVELWAYGDSSGDEELLALADHATWVGRRARSG